MASVQSNDYEDYPLISEIQKRQFAHVFNEKRYKKAEQEMIKKKEKRRIDEKRTSAALINFRQ